jgi:hypothetical protein
MTNDQQQVNPLQVMVMQAMVSALTVNIFAQAMGMLMAAAELGVAPLGQLPAEKGIEDLKKTYGADAVNEAILTVGPEADIVSLAYAVEGVVHDRLVDQYGEYIVNTAFEACGIMDYRCVLEVCKAMSGEGVTPSTPEVIKERAVNRGKLAGRHKAEPVKDTKTGKVYQSKSKAGMAVAAEYGLDPTDTFVWYKVVKQDPSRFVKA